MTETPKPAPLGSFALVSYVPEPLGSFLHSLRQILPAEKDTQAHITILPPRPLKVPVQTAILQTQAVLERFSPFEVHLSLVDSFPRTNILYLDVGDGLNFLYEMHAALSTGDLGHAEAFEFRPHLTIGGPVPPEQLEPVKRLTEQKWRSSPHAPGFTLAEIVGLWSPSGETAGDWRRFWCYRLKANSARTS